MLDPQMKRGLLESCILAALYREESYGYKIIKDLSGCVEISESTLYPILRRLEASGCLSARSVEHNGRLRKIYSITGEGRRQLESFISSWNEVQAMYEFMRRAAQ